MKTNNKKAKFNKIARRALGFSIIGLYAVLVILIFIALKPTKELGLINLAFVPIPTNLPTPTPTPSPTPTPTPIPTPTNKFIPSTSITKAAPTVAPKEIHHLIDNLIFKLPYEGDGFSVKYNFPTNEFILIIKIKNKEKVYVDFNKYLKENGIENMSSIKRLVIRFDPPQPQPTYTPIPLQIIPAPGQAL